MKIGANGKGKNYIGGPTDPEQGKAAAGIGALFLKGLVAYEIPNPTDDYRSKHWPFHEWVPKWVRKPAQVQMWVRR